MKELSKEGYVIEYWDISRLFWSDLHGVESYEDAKKSGIQIIHYESKRDFRKAIHANTDALYISIMTFELRVLFVFWYLTRYNCKKAVFAYWPLPIDCGLETNIVCESYFHKIKSRIKSLFNPVKYVRGVENYVKRGVVKSFLNFGIIRLYDYCFVGGEQGWKGIGQVPFSDLSRTKFYEVNNWDYDRFLKCDIKRETKPYMVFLYEYYPFHPDGRMFYGKCVNADQYYSDMDAVFCKLESFYKMPVVIAAHPKALKYKEINYFNGREVVFNSTIELVAKSSIVLAHDSLSIGFAVMYRKPLVFVNSKEIRDKLPNNSNHIIAFSAFFRSPMIWADCFSTDCLPQNFELSHELEGLYSEVKKQYMSCVEPPTFNIELLKIYFKEIFDENNKNS